MESHFKQPSQIERRETDVHRALKLANIGLEDSNATPDDFANYLEALCDVADGTCDFKEFAEKTNLKGRERLN